MDSKFHRISSIDCNTNCLGCIAWVDGIGLRWQSILQGEILFSNIIGRFCGNGSATGFHYKIITIIYAVLWGKGWI